MTTPGLTVAIATCGNPDGLARCLAALAGGLRPPEEILVVDQDPSHASHGVTNAAAIPVRHLTQERRGLSASRNLALARTTHDWLAVTDDDCVPDPAWADAIRRALSADSEAVHTGPILPLGARPDGGYAVSLREGTEPVVHENRIAPWHVGSGANMAGPVEVFERAGGWDERLGTGSAGQAAEDIALIDELLRRGVRIRFDPGIVLRHEWADRDRRMATRWSYGFGLGAFFALRLTRRDRAVLSMMRAYLRPHVSATSRGLVTFDRDRVAQHARAIGGMTAGLGYGIRAHRRPSRMAVPDA